MEFYIDIENGLGLKQGAGPIVSATSFRVTRRIDAAGEFAFEMPATDPLVAEIQPLRVVRCYALLGAAPTAWVEVGDGVIEQIGRRFADDGTVMVTVSGGDRVRQLAQRTVQALRFVTPAGGSVSQLSAILDIIPYAPGGWIFGADASSPNQIYARHAGESVLQGLISIAQKSYSHFYYAGGRVLTFDSVFQPSGLRAVAGLTQVDAEQCVIVDLETVEEAFDLVTRIYPYGAGQGDVRMGLFANDGTLPAQLKLPGHTYTITNYSNNSYIECTSATAQYGLIERTVEFKDIAPISNTTADLVSATAALRAVALRWLNQHLAPSRTYRLTVAGCGQLLRPMQSIRVIVFDPVAGVDIDEQLNILETTWEVGAAGVQTVGLVVSTGERLPATDADAVAHSIEQGTVFQAHPQLNANSYTVGYQKFIDPNETAAFRFRFGGEVLQLQQVLFEFQLLPLESTIKSVAGISTTTNNFPGTLYVTSTTESVPIGPHTHNVPISTHDHTLTPNLVTTYGIYRESAANTFALGDLEYAINGSGWVDLAGALAVGAGWYRLDLTNGVMDGANFRPLQESNLLEIRRKATGAAGKTAMIDGLLGVRNIVQGIAYT